MVGFITPGMEELLAPLPDDLRIAFDDPLAGGAGPTTACFTIATLLDTIGINNIVDSRSEMAARARLGTVFLNEDFRQGLFTWSDSDWSTIVALDPNQGILVPPIDDPTGASGAWIRSRDRAFVNAEWFGAKEWSFGDFTTNLQASLNFAGAEGGDWYLPPKIFKQSATLQMSQACRMFGSGNWETDYRPLGVNTGVLGSRLQWTSATVPNASTLPQILVESNPQGTQLQQPIVEKLIIDGNARAGYGVWVSSSIMPMVRDIHAEQHIVAGVAFLPRGATTIGPQWDNIFTTTRTSANCFAASGIIQNATDANSYNTGGHGGYLRAASTSNGTGWGLVVGNQDAMLIDKVEIFGFSASGQAQGMYFSYDSLKGGGHSRKHYISYFAGGTIKTDPGCVAINVQASGETLYLNLDPDSETTLSTFDQATGDQYQTLLYKYTAENDLDPANAKLTGATLSTVGGSQAISMVHAASDSATWSHLVPPDWNHGQVVGLRVIYGASTGDPGTNCRLRITISCPRTNGTTSANGADLEFSRVEDFTIAAASVADTFYTADVELAWPVEFKKRCAVVVTVQRLGSDALDTSTQALKVVGVAELYKADGPNSTAGEDPSTSAGRSETGAWSTETGYYEYIGGVFPLPAPSSFASQALTIISAFSPTPTAFQQRLINYAVQSLLDAGLWTKLDLLYLTAAEQQAWSLVNWKFPGANDLSLVSTPNFQRNKGWKSASSGYLATGVNVSALTQYTQNSGHIGAFIYNNETSGATVIGTSSGNGIYLNPRNASDLFQGKLNNNTAQTQANTDSRGHWVVNRTGSPTPLDFYHNGALFSNETAASAAPLAEEIRICAGNTFNTTHQVGAMHIGAGLSATEIMNLARIVSYYVGHLRG